MPDRYLDGVSCIAFDYCGTLAELRPTSEEILADWLRGSGAGDVAAATISSALKRASAEMPYSSLVVRDEQKRRSYFARFNARVLALLGYAEGDCEALFGHFRGHERHWTLRPGAEALLRELARRGYRVILVSNFDSTLEQLLSRDGTAGLFDALFVSAVLGIEKPDLAFYRHVCDTLGLAAGEIAMVGDDLRLDVQPALSIGMKAVLLRPDAGDLMGTRLPPADGYLEIPALDDLLRACPAAGAGATAKGGDAEN